LLRGSVGQAGVLSNLAEPTKLDSNIAALVANLRATTAARAEPKLEEVDPKLPRPMLPVARVAQPVARLAPPLQPVRTEKSDPRKALQPVADWNFETRKAELVHNGETLISEKVEAADPGLGEKSPVRAHFPGGMRGTSD
jgi:hypothetical protein